MDHFDIDKPERIIRRHGSASKSKNKLGFYLYISAGFIILFALLTAIWLLLKDPEIPQSAIYSTPSNEPDILAGESNGITLPLNIDAPSPEVTNYPDTQSQSGSQFPVENEIALTPTVNNDLATPVVTPSASSSTEISNLPLDYALTANKLITNSPAATQATAPTPQLESANVNLTDPSKGTEPTLVQKSPEPPKSEEVIQTTTTVQSQLNNAAVQITPKKEPKVPAEEAPIAPKPTTEYTMAPPPANTKNNPGVIENVKPQVTPTPVQNTLNQPTISGRQNNPGVIETTNTLKTPPQTPNQTAVTPSATKQTEPVKAIEPVQPIVTTPQPINQKKTVTPQTAVINNPKTEGQSLPRPTAPNTITQSTPKPNVQESAATLQAKETLPPPKQPQTQATRPASTSQTNRVSSQRIDNGRGGNIAIQVASASRPEGLRKLAVEQNLTTGRVLETERNGSKWYVLVTGHYASRNEAQRAIPTLPPELQKNNPWVRETP